MALLEHVGWRDAYQSPQSTFYVKNKIGQVITFEAYGHNSPVGNSLKSGWAKDLEPWGTWSNASVATLVLLPPIALSKSNYILVNYRAFVVPGHPAHKMEIWVNGVFNQAVELTKPDGILRIDNLTDQNTLFNAFKQFSTSFVERVTHLPFNEVPIKIEFRMLNPARPIDVGLGKDKRLLGIGLISLVFK